jgi:UDP-glucose:(heptosyl)LPS alpha-1,3-glucosyltransferase
VKIAIVTKQYRSAGGGGEGYFRRASEELLSNGHEVHAFLHRWEGSLTPGLHLHRVPMVRRPPLLKILSFSLFCRHILKGQNFDIVYGLTQACPQDVHRLGGGLQRAWFEIRYQNPPLRAVMAAARPSFTAHLWLERRMLRAGQCRRVVTNSRLCRDQLLDAYPFPPERVRVIYNGVDHVRFHPGIRRQYRHEVRRALGVPEDEIVLLYASHNFSRKGLQTLIRALARTDRSFRLVVVGRGGPRRYDLLARRLGVHQRLQFMGVVEAIEAYYGAADALVLPTQYDPFANVCLEAMACGLPVVTTAANGAAEIIQERQAGIIVQNPADIPALGQALQDLRDPVRREGMGRRGVEASTSFTWEAHTKELIQLFEEVAAEKRKTPQERGAGRQGAAVRMEIREAYRPQLQALGLDHFERVMAFRNGQRYKENQYRSVIRITGKDGPSLYLKRHKRRPALREFLAPFFHGSLPLSSGRKEWLSALRLMALGIPTLEPVAWGERVRRLGLDQESFFMSTEIDGAERLESFLPKRYRPPLTEPEIGEKRALIRQLASLAAGLHEARVHHRDLYLGHIFIREDPPRGFQLFLIDLHRVEQRPRLSWRWRIKDLAALNFTAEGMPLTRMDRLRFYKQYRRTARLDGREKAVIRAILRKAEQIGQHTAKILARRTSGPSPSPKTSDQ